MSENIFSFLSIVDQSHDENINLDQILEEFNRNGYNDVEYEPEGPSPYSDWQKFYADGIIQKIVTAYKIYLDSIGSPYFSQIWKPKQLEHESVTKQLFNLPKIVSLKPNQLESYEGFGFLSLDPINYKTASLLAEIVNDLLHLVPLEYSEFPPLTSSVFKIAAKETQEIYAKKNKKHCKICQKNIKPHPDRIYTSHSVKDANGDVICPVLKNYICPKCEATGDKAHTLKYCPRNGGTIPQNICKKKYCPICKKCVAKYPERIYTSHNTTDSKRNTICPVLRNYVCPTCGATGKNAHTKKYCPKYN